MTIKALFLSMNKQKVEAARRRLFLVEEIAEALRHEPHLHRLAMKAVFIMEDCLFALSELRDQQDGKSVANQRW